MELDKIKETWEVHTSIRESTLIVSKSTFESVLTQKAANSKKKILRLMGIDAVIMLLINAGFISLLYFMQLSAKHSGALIIALITLILFIHYHLSVLLIQRGADDVSVCRGIRQTLVYLKSYFLIYKIAFPALVFVAILGSFQLEIFFLGDFLPMDSNFTNELIISFSTAILSFVILHYLIKSIYQGDINNLASLLKELEDETI